MELDELKASWQRLDQRVQELILINRRLMTDTVIRKVRWRLAPVVAGAIANIVIGAFFAVVAGSFWGRTWTRRRCSSRASPCMPCASFSS